MDEELQKLRKQVEELTELYNLQSHRAMDYASSFMRNKREWQGLTDEEIIRLRHLYDPTAHWSLDIFARVIEAKLKEKNT